MTALYEITEENFLNWMFDTGPDHGLMVKQQQIKDLKEQGYHCVTPLDIFESCEHSAIPLSFIEGMDGRDGELGDLDHDYKVVLTERSKATAKDTCLTARFRYGSIDFAITGLVDKTDLENRKDYGLGYVEGSDMLTDAEGFDMHTITAGREFIEAYWKINDGTPGNVEITL